MRPKSVMLAVTAALIGSLLGLGPASFGTPEAAACESHPGCGGGTPPDEPLTIRGTLTTFGGVFVVDARSEGGQVGGVASLVLGPTGPVREVLPPGDGRDHYCVNIVRDEATGFRANFSVRDVGDGVTTFDEIAVFAGDADLTCRDATPANFFTATAGDITVSR